MIKYYIKCLFWPQISENKNKINNRRKARKCINMEVKNQCIKEEIKKEVKKVS